MNAGVQPHNVNPRNCNLDQLLLKNVRDLLPLKFFMTSFLVVPGLLLASGDACLLIPFVPGLDKAEKFALFCESVISVFSQSLILLCKTESLNRRLL